MFRRQVRNLASEGKAVAKPFGALETLGFIPLECWQPSAAFSPPPPGKPLSGYATLGITTGVMTHLELNHVALHVTDVEKSSDFYRRVLLLCPMPRPAFKFPGAWFRLGQSQELHLIGERSLPVISNDRGTHFALRIDDMDAWEAHLKQVGVNYLPRRTRPDGAWQIYVSDPDGHVIELCDTRNVPNHLSG